jgi:CheY-like chemotaxis protein
VLIESPSLLITDDDSDFRITLREVLEPRGYRTLLASDGEEALEIVQRQSVHLLLLDMHMPRLTGLETIRRVQQLDRVLPCILLSARMDDKLAEEARQARAFCALPKTASWKQIRETVDQALRATYGWPRRPGGL